MNPTETYPHRCIGKVDDTESFNWYCRCGKLPAEYTREVAVGTWGSDCPAALRETLARVAELRAAPPTAAGGLRHKDPMTVYPSTVLDVMFSYQPPNEDTRPRYAATAKARADYDAAIAAIFADLEASEASTPHVDYVALHARVSVAARVYAGVLNDMCGDPKDMESHVASAILSVTVSRMWANKAIRAPLGPVRGRLMALARTEAEEAEMLANAAIALAVPVAAAYDAMGDQPK